MMASSVRTGPTAALIGVTAKEGGEIVRRGLPVRAARCLAAVGALLAGYLVWVRPWQLRWGASDDEVYRQLPGDEVVQNPAFDATRAVTVEARPEQIWPWIVQMGVGRAGWYSYDWLDNFGRPSAEHVAPEWQQIQEGSYVAMGRGENQGMWVRAFEPNHWLVWGDKKDDVTWLWMLHPEGESRTRLITRVRMCYRWTSPTILFSLLVEFADIIMMRKSMLGIKARAERTAKGKIPKANSGWRSGPTRGAGPGTASPESPR